MIEKWISKRTLPTGCVGTKAEAANDRFVVSTITRSRGRHAASSWSALSTVKSHSATAATQICISRENSPLLYAYVANSCVARLRGLFAFPPLTATQALVLYPCSAVHTFGFKSSIDVVFLGRCGRILKCVEMRPGSLSMCRQSHSVLEMASGTLQRLNLAAGQRLDVDAGGEHNV